MLSRFDRRVVPDTILRVIRSIQARVSCRLGGGAALSGAFLAHRLSRDVDLFFESTDDLRRAVAEVHLVEASTGARIEIRRDAGTFVRAQVVIGTDAVALDLVHDAIELEPGLRIEDVTLRSLVDLRASKLTCLLSRTEPRDLVDVLFLERAGHPPEADLPLALRKDAGIDPAVLAWLLAEFPVEPMPAMLEPLAASELRDYRDRLRERFRTISLP